MSTSLFVNLGKLASLIMTGYDKFHIANNMMILGGEG